MVRLTKKGKKLLVSVALSLVMAGGVKIVVDEVNKPKPVKTIETDQKEKKDGVLTLDVQAEEKIEIPLIEEVPAIETITQSEPVLTRNDNCTINEDTVIYLDDDTSSKVVRNVNINDTVYRMFSTNTGFSLVRYDKYIGYVETSKLESSSLDGSAPSYADAQNLGMVRSTEVNFRMGPGKDFETYGFINKNDGLELIARSSNGWYIARRTDILGNQRIGFISSDFVDVVSNEEYALRLPRFISAVVSTANDYVNIREGSSKEFESIGRLYHGESIKMLELCPNGWYKVELNDGRIGYLSGDYAKPTYIVQNMDSYKVVGIAEDAQTYNAPNGTVTGSLPKYEIGIVYREDNGYYLIKTYDGEMCYVDKDSTRELTSTCVVVDISDQMLYVFENGNLTLTSKVTTGADGTETNIGFGRIQCHEMSTPDHQIYLQNEAKTYKTAVKYWMRIEWLNELIKKWYTNGQGAHDLENNKYDGKRKSHGCIRTQKAKELYDRVEVGDSVLVKK